MTIKTTVSCRALPCVLAMMAILLPCTLMAQNDSTAAISADSERVDVNAIIRETSDIPLLLEIARRAYVAQDYPVYTNVMTKLADLRPYHSQFQFKLAEALALQDRKSEAYNILIQLTQQGLSFSMDGDTDFDNIKGTEVYYHIQDIFDKSSKPQGKAQIYFNVGNSALMIESFVYDPVHDRFLIGDVAGRQILSVGESGKPEPFITDQPADQLLGVFGLAIDASRGILWVSDAVTPHVRGVNRSEIGRAGLARYDLESGEFLSRHDFPIEEMGKRAGLVQYVTVDDDGTVYASDSMNKVIYRLSPGSETPEVFLHSPKFTSLRGIALHADKDILYFADYELGLFAVSLSDRKAHKMVQGSTNLGGIEDIDWYQDSLILIQNSFNPQRVIRVQVDETGLDGFHGQVLISGFDQLDYPRSGGIMKDQYILVADSHLGQYDPITGQVKDGVELTAQQTLSIDLSEGWAPPTVADSSEVKAHVESMNEAKGVASDGGN